MPVKTKLRRAVVAVFGLAFAFGAGAIFSRTTAQTFLSNVVTRNTAKLERADWGDFYTYFQGETYGTRDALNGVAEIKPGMEIHPPHQHAEEEFLMVLAGAGTWHVNGKTFAAQQGDILYAAPWDVHGIKNTGDQVLKFVVWKWNNRGVPVPASPVTNK